MSKVELSREMLLKRGYCCGKSCKECPYVEKVKLTIIEKLEEEEQGRDRV